MQPSARSLTCPSSKRQTPQSFHASADPPSIARPRRRKESAAPHMPTCMAKRPRSRRAARQSGSSSRISPSVATLRSAHSSPCRRQHLNDATSPKQAAASPVAHTPPERSPARTPPPPRTRPSKRAAYPARTMRRATRAAAASTRGRTRSASAPVRAPRAPPRVARRRQLRALSDIEPAAVGAAALQLGLVRSMTPTEAGARAWAGSPRSN